MSRGPFLVGSSTTAQDGGGWGPGVLGRARGAGGRPCPARRDHLAEGGGHAQAAQGGWRAQGASGRF